MILYVITMMEINLYVISEMINVKVFLIIKKALEKKEIHALAIKTTSTSDWKKE